MDPLRHLYDGLPWLGYATDFSLWEKEMLGLWHTELLEEQRKRGQA